MTAKPVKIMETVLRDGHQSLLATRMRFQDMESTLEQLDNVGYAAIEAWGGATFDSCLRFLNEDPWERLRGLRKHLVKTPIQMLLRGQNVLGYNHYADDVVREFVMRAVDNGVGRIRIFDALNDVENLKFSGVCLAKYGLKHEIVVTMMDLPPGCVGAHDVAFYEKTLREILDSGIPYHSICFIIKIIFYF